MKEEAPANAGRAAEDASAARLLGAVVFVGMAAGLCRCDGRVSQRLVCSRCNALGALHFP